MVYDPRWLHVLSKALGHAPYLLDAARNGQRVGILPTVRVRSPLFRSTFLVSLPYLNTGGVLADDPEVATSLVQSAIHMAEHFRVRFLELRHESVTHHPQLTSAAGSKVHARLEIPRSKDLLWTQLKAKVRNQVRKAERYQLHVQWGSSNLVRDFHRVFSHNMRDLGTPTYGVGLFQEIISQFGDRAEICVLRFRRKPVAGALLLHGNGVTEVPSASCLRTYNGTNANMLMYWHLLCRAIERGQHTFDFGRSTEGSGTFRFKKQWGAQPSPAAWQYYLRQGPSDQMRPDSGRYDKLIRIWRLLPVSVTRILGPAIVRGIP